MLFLFFVGWMVFKKNCLCDYLFLFFKNKDRKGKDSEIVILV